jgi:hypothetical protein
MISSRSEYSIQYFEPTIFIGNQFSEPESILNWIQRAEHPCFLKPDSACQNPDFKICKLKRKLKKWGL